MTSVVYTLLIAATLCVLLLLLDAFGCSCELQTHPSGQSGSSWKDTGIPLVGSVDPARPFGRPAPRNDGDGGV